MGSNCQVALFRMDFAADNSVGRNTDLVNCAFDRRRPSKRSALKSSNWQRNTINLFKLKHFPKHTKMKIKTHELHDLECRRSCVRHVNILLQSATKRVFVGSLGKFDRKSSISPEQPKQTKHVLCGKQCYFKQV